MRARVPVVVKITLQSPAQRSLVPHDEVVQALSPDGAHESFDVRILPWGSRRSNHFFDPHTGGDGPSALYPLLRHVNQMLVAWAMQKFKRFKDHKVRASQFLQRLAKTHKALFVHWDIGMTGVFA